MSTILEEVQPVRKKIALIILVVGYALGVISGPWWWVHTPKKPVEVSSAVVNTRVQCPAFSPDETRSCVLTEEWSKPIGIDRPARKDEYLFCIFVPEGGQREQRLVGPDTFEYRSAHGVLPISYRLVRESTCPDYL